MTTLVAKSRQKGYSLSPYLYILPGLAIYALFILWPILQTVWYSFTEWDGLTSPRFLGLGNYLNLLRDQTFLYAIRNNLLFIFFYTLLPVLFALFLTALLTRRKIRGLAFYRAGLYFPQVMAMVVVGVVWRWIYHPTSGPLNQLLRWIGLGSLARPWLGDFDTALPSIGLIGTWFQYGFCMILFIAGVQKIEESLYDAARIDGAGEWQEFRFITLPSLRYEIAVALVTTLISAMRIFDLVYVTTRGGPGRETIVAALYLYRNAFSNNRVGYASAVAVILTILILIISAVVFRYQSRREAELGS